MCQQGKGEFAFIVAEPWLAASKVPEKKSRGVQSLARDALHILNVRSLKVWLGRRHEPHVERNLLTIPGIGVSLLPKLACPLLLMSKGVGQCHSILNSFSLTNTTTNQTL